MVNARPMRRLTVSITIVLTGVATLAAMAISQTAAQGVLIGGLTGAIAFWIMARQMERVTKYSKEVVPALVYRSTFTRLGLYGAALVCATLLDPHTMHGLIGAVAGLALGYMVLIGVGIAQSPK